ncbi:hypothetical protein K491DRAFT_676952 [Lophiostoma macrostomum CBS 122681]|uniref:polynucleotide adenylyltransferase n=1 Tax=Lophiostoma macrostomum CBS 122681 TaxID=1314788 RepID=A0A6A6TET8_9PLEO|nr:hypothetical protein K491DRAFT_676952 [Lophiostoma macrostomum CBS 122681]
MAASEGTSPSSIAVSSFDTALCIIPPPDQSRAMDQLRSLYDKAYGKWPPHVNVIYPFVTPELLTEAKNRIEARIARGKLDGSHDVFLNQAGSFSHRNSHTVFLQSSSTQCLDALRSMALEALGQTPSTYNFHLTIGQSEDQHESSRDFLLSKARLIPKVEIRPDLNLAILVRERTPGQTQDASRMRLWSILSFPSLSMKTASPLIEYWLPRSNQSDKALYSPDSVLESDPDERVETALYSRSIQPGTTYHYDGYSERWLVNTLTSTCAFTSSDLKVSSYNVLVDCEYPPSRDRDPLLLHAILSGPASADIIILQEVSDDFLSYLLADSRVQKHYLFSTHGPPEQPDIGPLPSLRNVVMLSRLPFSWEFVPFHRRHKGAVVAKFDTGASSSLVVAGIHLTCGLTDGSVAAKRVQLHNVIDHLKRNHSSSSWIIAGDFNITTSVYVIETALKNNSISQHATEILASIQTTISEAGLLDAWTVSRIQATDNTLTMESDDLFEGEESATYNPRENQLAAATSGTSNNRPQRYDRILVRPESSLRVAQFNQFGLSTEQNGQQIVPSDHFGIRATMRLFTSSRTSDAASVSSLRQTPIRSRFAESLLADTSSMHHALEINQMVPTTDEQHEREDAFSLLKAVLTGSSTQFFTSDIPMVIVPVGSYALGVWTSSSDIDCLCIGSISSKMFFKLAKQRINRADAQGVRLIRRVDANTGTMLELSVNGVAFDLQYCPAARIVERWPEFHSLHHSDPIFNLSMLSLRKLKPYRDISYILRTVPSLATFRLAHRCIKLWTVQRGLYSSKFGFLGGIHITLMLSWLHKQMTLDHGTVSAADLVCSFFHHYSTFDWKNEVVYDSFFHNTKPKYQRNVREPMVILGFHNPNANVAHTSTSPGLYVLIKEFKMADEYLCEEGMSWDCFLGQRVAHIPSSPNTGMEGFLASHDSYAQINIQYWGRSLAKGKGLVGWVESRSLSLVVDIHKSLPDLSVRIWPARFTDLESSDTVQYYQGCYLIGLSRKFCADTYANKEDKVLAKQSLLQTFSRFLDQLHAEDKYYDSSTSWIGISLVKPSDVKDLRLDSRDWGDYEADLGEDSEDEVEIGENQDDDDSPASQKLPLRIAPSSSNTPVSTKKLRPASDILNRLRWDSNLDPSEYIIGYEDRFLGAKETSLERWKTEQTDEEFIPQHRILYFKRKSDGMVVWERRTRIDMVFGSGEGVGQTDRN